MSGVADVVAPLMHSVMPGRQKWVLVVSLGLALCPADGKTASELVQAADQRMYAAKTERKRTRRRDQAVS